MDPSRELAWQVNGLADLDTRLRITSEVLLTLFPAIGAGWVSFDAVTGQAECRNFPQDYPSVSTQAFLEVYRDHPLVVSYMSSAWDDEGIRRLSDLVSDRQLRLTRTYQEAFRPLGIDRQFSMLTGRPSPQGMRAWALVRSGKDFRDAELDVAKPVQAMLRLIERAADGSDGTAYMRAERFSLTPREQEIMRLLGRGLTLVAVGHLLDVSPRTVGKHLEHVYAKLGCTNRIEALRILREQ